jgi:hypothetical protein
MGVSFFYAPRQDAHIRNHWEHYPFLTIGWDYNPMVNAEIVWERSCLADRDPDPDPDYPNQCFNIDELVKSRISDGFVKSSRSRLANPEE